MSEQIRFETPENIEVVYDVAGLGTRFTAWMLDQFLVTIVVIVLFFALLLTGAAGDTLFEQLSETVDDSEMGQPPQLTSYLVGFFYLLYSLGGFVYFALMELLMRGQTIGKRKLGLRVVQSDGFALRPGSIFLRTIFRVADHLPPLWIIPVVSTHHRRLGDFVAGTAVVIDDPDEMSELREQLSQQRPSEAQFRFSTASLAKVSNQDIETVERLLERYPSMQKSDSAPLLARVVDSLSKRLDVELPEESLRVQFLRDFLAAQYHQEYRRLG
jgi:uncharacterized RDD family membrane protein YckC